jgi:hypothetical protein
MAKLFEKVSINGFSIEDIDITPVEELSNLLPKNGVIDINIAEKGLVYTLEGQNFCQEKVAQLDRWIGFLESEKNKAWSDAALNKAKQAGHKTVKDKEWYAQSDDDYVNAYNSLALAKACKKWLENKTAYFSGWHYALKTFLRRDYAIENASGIKYNAGTEYNPFPTDVGREDDFADGENDIEWK